MTFDEKLAVIACNVRDIIKSKERTDALVTGAMLDLARIANEADNAYSAIDLAELVVQNNDRRMLAEFCRLYYKYTDSAESLLPVPEITEAQPVVMIPEISKLRDVISLFSEKVFSIECEYGDSFRNCAENVEYGHAGYVLMPLRDPTEGRLRSFDKLRETHGLKIHFVICVPGEDDGEYAFQICGVGFPDITDLHPTRLSLVAETNTDPLEYLCGIGAFEAAVISSDFEITDGAAEIKAVLDIQNIGDRELSALIMYLSAGADLKIDGIYAEYR